MKGKANFIFTPENETYTVKLKKTNLWWLLLLLLPFLLLIPFKKDITVKTIEASSKTPVQDVDIKINYVDYQVIRFNKFGFFTHDTLQLYGVTDSTGTVIFKDVRYTLYSSLFFGGKKAEISGSQNCFYGDSLYKFHKLKSNPPFELLLYPRVYDYYFDAIDIVNSQPVPGATVKAIVKQNGKVKVFEGKTMPDGKVFFENFPYCGEYKIFAEHPFYDSDTISGDSKYLYGNDTLHKIPMRPKTTSLNFFARDLKTKEPLPNTTGYLIINGDTVATTITNTNGFSSPAEGEFTNVPVTADFTILASHNYYYDTTKSDNVQHWQGLSDSGKTLYLRPGSFSLKFKDTDGHRGLAGVRNDIYVNGKKLPHPIFSNANGYFTVSGIKPDDKISIIASKPGYETNDYTVKNIKAADLQKADQNRRTIPLRKKQQPTPPPPPPPNPNPQPGPPPNTHVFPCEAPQESGGQGITTKVHSIGNSKRFTITWDMYNVPDQLIVYCGTGSAKKQIFSTRGAVSGRGRATLYCKQNYITVKIIGQQSGTQWEYQMQCE